MSNRYACRRIIGNSCKEQENIPDEEKDEKRQKKRRVIQKGNDGRWLHAAMTGLTFPSDQELELCGLAFAPHTRPKMRGKLMTTRRATH